jgi:hypothetical protein
MKARNSCSLDFFRVTVPPQDLRMLRKLAISGNVSWKKRFFLQFQVIVTTP